MLLSHKHVLRSAAATGTDSQVIDGLQDDLREGPAIDALEQRLIRVDDLGTEERWPRFGPAALASTPVRSLVALGSRDIIGQAKGMLMERFSIGAAAAFALLTRLSQESGKPVVVIAKETVEINAAPRTR